MNEKNTMSVDDLVAFLDKQMGAGLNSMKPQFEEGKMVKYETKPFTADIDDDCPSCANIPNLMDFDPDNMPQDEE